jgi:hypothetical protein
MPARKRDHIESDPERVYLIPGDEEELTRAEWLGLLGWKVVVELAMQDGVLAVQTLKVEPGPVGLLRSLEPDAVRPPRGGLTSADLRRISLGGIVAEAKAQLHQIAAWRDLIGISAAAGDIRGASWAAGYIEQGVSKAGTVGRAGYGDGFYADVSVTYLRLVGEGHRRDLWAAFAREIKARTGRDIPVETIRGWVQRARRSGFLAMSTAGTAGAAPGPRLIAFAETVGAGGDRASGKKAGDRGER